MNSNIMVSRTEMMNVVHKIQALFEDRETKIQVLSSKIEYQGETPSCATIVENTKAKVKLGNRQNPRDY